jgi:SAM-dependent methyltransferase
MPSLDLATVDKVPVIQRLMGPVTGSMALDIGCGTGYTTRRVFGTARTVYLDGHQPNLLYCEESAAEDAGEVFCVLSDAICLPFASETFDYILCSEVFEHLKDDDAAVAEIARVLSPKGRLVITVPYSGIGFASFLELCGIKTVHDYPGPEFHVRPGYDEESMGALLGRHGLEIEQSAFYFRFFTRLMADGVSLAHIAYQRLVHRRTSWTWAEAMEAEGGLAAGLYRKLFPVLRAAMTFDRLLAGRRGFGLVVKARKASTV